MISKAAAEAGRALFMARIEQLDPEGRAELMLSGGVDSATVLFAMLATGRRPHCLTFQVGDQVSSDLQVSQRLCEHFGLDHTVVQIPRAKALLVADIQHVLQHVDWSLVPRIKKSVVQCVHPFKYLLKHLRGTLAITGLGGDSYYLTTRREQVALHAHGEAYVSRWRRSYAQDPGYSDFHIAAYARRFGVDLPDAYDFGGFARWIQQFTVTATNTPIQKYASVVMFGDYWRQVNVYRPNSPFQINSGLREYHDSLLLEPAFNPHGHKAVIGLYNQLAKDLGIVAGGNLPPRDDDDNLLDRDGNIVGDPWREVPA